MPDYAVMTSFKAKDNVSPAFDRMGRNAERMRDRTSSAFRNATKDGYKFMTVVKGILAANAIRGGLGMIGSGMQKTATDFLKFDDVLIGAISRFDDLGPAMVRNVPFMQQFGQKVRKSIDGTRFAAVDAAGAVNELAKAGYQSSAGLGMLRHMMDFATAGQEDLVQATTMSSDLLGSFGMRSKDVTEQMRNHIRLNDMLTKSGLLSTGGIQDLNESLKSTAPLVSELDMAPVRLLAITTALTNAGIKGDIAATAIKRAMINIYSGKNDAEFKANGIITSDPLTGKLKQFPEIMAEISRGLAKARPDVRAKALFNIFGAYGLAGNVKILRQLEMIRDYEEKIGASAGVTKMVADAQNMSTYAKLIMLGNTAMEKFFQVLEKFNGQGQTGIMGLTEKIKNFDPKGMIESLQITANALLFLWTILKPILKWLPELMVLWGSFRIALAAVKFWPVIVQIATLVRYAWACNGVVGVLIAAWGLLNTAFIASPIGWIVMGIAAIIAAVVLLETKFKFFSKTLTTLKGIFSDVWEVAKRFMSDIAAPFVQFLKYIGYVGDAEPTVNMSSSMQDSIKANHGSFEGRLLFENMPANVAYSEKTTGTPMIQTQYLGANP